VGASRHGTFKTLDMEDQALHLNQLNWTTRGNYTWALINNPLIIMGDEAYRGI
jgi:hypothetical protein